MTPNEVLWLLCGAAIVVMGLVALFFGASAGTRSLDDVYERRARRQAAEDPPGPAAPAQRPAVDDEAIPERRMADATA